MLSIADLYAQHHQHVRTFARRMLRDEASAEDLVQETFLALPAALRSYRGDSPLRSFVIGVAANHARHHVRAAVRRRSVHERSASVAPLAPPSTPEDRAERRELGEALERALDQLPVDHRDALVLCELEERSAAEVARIVGAKEATIRTRVFHAKKKLRALLFIALTLGLSAAWAMIPSLLVPPSPPPPPPPPPVNVPVHAAPVNVPVHAAPVNAPAPAPAPMPEPARPRPVAPPPAKPTASVDRETPLYRAAHEAHFIHHDPARALDAWDAYLAAYPQGRFAPEAQYNRAISLLRLGRRDEAHAALRPFADGAYGGYRQREATRLLE